MRQLSALMVRREPGLLTPLPELLPRSETRLLIVAFNRYIDRLRVMISRRERFSADASHQLKTPLAVLKTQASVAPPATIRNCGAKVCRRCAPRWTIRSC